MDRPLEVIRQERIALLEAARAVDWSLADLDADAVRQFGAGVCATLASDEGCSANHVRQRLAVGRTWTAEARPALRDVPRSLLRACLQASHRLATQKVYREPGDILQQALTQGWSRKDVDALGAKASKAGDPCATCGRPLPVHAAAC